MSSTPVKIVIMVVAIFVTIYLGQVLLNGFGDAITTDADATFNATTSLGTNWTTDVGLVALIPLALIGWYVLRIVGGGAED
jgi:hypothetical protein